MSRSSRILIILIAALLLACAALLLLAPRSGTTARVYCGGELFTVVDLTAVHDSYALEVGAGNTLLVEPGRISMLHADCPDQLCVKQGAISSPLRPIVCLPNEVMVIVESDAAQELDAVTGGP